jgi:hypothetical protein
MLGSIETAGDAMQRVFERQRVVQQGVQAQRENTQEKLSAGIVQAQRGTVSGKQGLVEALQQTGARGSVLDMTV